MTAVLGDFLTPATEHIALAITHLELPETAAGSVIRELCRVITSLARYLSDTALPDSADPARPHDTPHRLATRTRLALRRSALSLQPAAGAPGPAPAGDTHPAAAHLAAAADYLAAGRDLLQARRSPAPDGSGLPGSPAALAGHRYWAAVAGSAPVTAALLAQITGHARTLAPWAAQLSQSAPEGAVRLALHDATRWLYTAAGPAATWQQQRSLPAADRGLLHAIPVTLIPARQPPAPAEPVTALCAGITVTADRLRHATVTFAPQANASPAANSLSWRRHALAAAITTQATQLTLHNLTRRAAHLNADPDLRRHLDNAHAAARRAWPAWKAVSRQWDTITTGTRHDTPITAAAAEIGDLVLRAGRLAFRNPRWTPGTPDASPPRHPAQLAPRLADITTVTAAVHHASDALTLIAAADQQAIQAAAQASRLWIPTWLLPDDSDIPYRYSPCPASRIHELLTAYHAAITTASTLTTALDDLAAQTAAPSQVLSAPRRNAPPPASGHHDTPREDLTRIGIPEAGQVEKLLHDLHVTEPALLTRAELADATALDLIAEAAVTIGRRNNVRDPSFRRPRTSTGKQQQRSR